MKKRIPTFLSGMLTMALIGGLGVTALAATGQMTITVDPINIQVNGQTFQPKDANGADVPVFAYNGTTYAPLRALAEAYGLTVGYDQEANMATVGDPATDTTAPDTTATTYSDWTAEEEAAYLEFKNNHDFTFSGSDNFETKFHISGSTAQKRNVFYAELKDNVQQKDYSDQELEKFGAHLFSDLNTNDGEILHIKSLDSDWSILTDGASSYIIRYQD